MAKITPISAMLPIPPKHDRVERDRIARIDRGKPFVEQSSVSFQIFNAYDYNCILRLCESIYYYTSLWPTRAV